jgi:large subunit ribosomal protein L25
MSATHTYTATIRAALGTTATKALRASGQVPVTISRPGQDSLHVSLDNKQAEHLAHHVVHLAKVAIDGKETTVLKGDISRHPLKDNILHVDLLLVDEKSQIKVDVAVIPDGRNCPGLKAGGLIEQRLRKVKVLCAATAIPDSITLKLDDVALEQTVYAKSLEMPAGVKMVTRANLPVLSILIPRGMRKDVVAAEAAAATPAAGATAAASAAAPAKDAAKK